MFESVIAVLCDEAMNGSLSYTGHYSRRIFLQDTPQRAHIRYVLCEDDATVIESSAYAGIPPRGRECLIWGTIGSMGNDRVAHILCTYPPNPVVITAYWPDTEPSEWEDNFKRRARGGEGGSQ